jgi:hypothetical protein
MVLSFFVGVDDTSCKCLEDVRCISGGGWCCGGECEAGHDVFKVEASIMVLEFSVVRFDGETSFVDYLVLDVVVDISLIKIFTPL